MLMENFFFSQYSLFFKNFVMAATINNKPIFCLDIGAGPFKTKNQLRASQKSIKRCVYSSSRDEYTHHLLQTTYLSYDPAFSLKKVNCDCEKNTISICVMYNKNKHAGKEYRNYISSINSIIEYLLGINKKVVLFSTEKMDYKAVDDLYSLLKKPELIDFRDITDMNSLLTLYSETQLIIGTRMHSLIIGITQEIPIIGISWSNKVSELFKRCKLPDCIFDYITINNNISKIITTINKIINEKDLYIDTIRTFKQEANNFLDKETELIKSKINTITGVYYD